MGSRRQVGRFTYEAQDPVALRRFDLPPFTYGDAILPALDGTEPLAVHEVKVFGQSRGTYPERVAHTLGAAASLSQTMLFCFAKGAHRFISWGYQIHVPDSAGADRRAGPVCACSPRRSRATSVRAKVRIHPRERFRLSGGCGPVGHLRAPLKA